ncbi:hypothetical protein GH5_01963 [Leishmania sp. Ghana 2012 LV757]|uniref:hypothetical protein n=1 Tax=Leishmania sp. Ghana 2012 LV757 TaxID=2803181 RepID=UPI001B699244|nr:hypothetical protein GH5_01963 [Leishmania sp. Ghana 2012 LV757]
MHRESASSSQGGEDGGYGVTGENALRRPTSASPEASAVHRRSPLLTPRMTSTVCSPLLDRGRPNAPTVNGHAGSGVCGVGASASPQLPRVSSRFSLLPLRSGPAGSHMSASPLGGIHCAPHMPLAQYSETPIVLPMTSCMSPSFSSSTAAAQAVLKAVALPLQSHHLLRLTLGAFCMLNAAVAFLFAWMMRTQQANFALTAAKRRWDLKERSNATFKAGVYYVIIGLVLLVNRLNSILVVAVQLGVRFVRAGFPLLLRWLLWCARKVPESRTCGPLLRRFAPCVAGVSSENHRLLVRSRVARPSRSPTAAVPPVSTPTAHQSHGLLHRCAGSHLGSLLQLSLGDSPAESMVDLETDRRPRAATATSLSIRRRVG